MWFTCALQPAAASSSTPGCPCLQRKRGLRSAWVQKSPARSPAFRVVAKINRLTFRCFVIPAVLSRQIHILSISWVVAYLYIYTIRTCLIQGIVWSKLYILHTYYSIYLYVSGNTGGKNYSDHIAFVSLNATWTKSLERWCKWPFILVDQKMHNRGALFSKRQLIHACASISKLHKKDNLTFKSPKYRPWTPGLCNGSWREIMQIHSLVGLRGFVNCTSKTSEDQIQPFFMQGAQFVVQTDDSMRQSKVE